MRSLERKKLQKTEPSGSDRRVRIVRLTRSGVAELGRINFPSDDLARSMLSPLNQDQAQRLIAAMGEVERLMRVLSVEASRDLGAELIQSVREMKAGKVGRVRYVKVPEIVEARNKAGLSRQQFAEVLGVSPRTHDGARADRRDQGRDGAGASRRAPCEA